MLKSGCPVSPCSNDTPGIGPPCVVAVQGNTAFYSTRTTRKQENRFQTTNSRNQRKAAARAYKRKEAAEEKCSSSNCSTAEVPLGGILEDPYDEKARMQEKFLRENPEEELSKILAENSSKILAGNSSTRGPASNRPSVTGQSQLKGDRTIQIGAVDTQLERGDWRLRKGRNARVQSDPARSPIRGVDPAELWRGVLPTRIKVWTRPRLNWWDYDYSWRHYPAIGITSPRTPTVRCGYYEYWYDHF